MFETDKNWLKWFVHLIFLVFLLISQKMALYTTQMVTRGNAYTIATLKMLYAISWPDVGKKLNVTHCVYQWNFGCCSKWNIILYIEK